MRCIISYYGISIPYHTEVVVGFIGSPYITTEGEGATAVFRVGVISRASNLTREMSLLFSTFDAVVPCKYMHYRLESYRVL